MAMLNRRADITQPCLTPVFTWWSVIDTSSFACEVVVKALDEKDDFLWDSICTDYAPKAFPVDAVKSLLEVYKVDVQLSLPFCAVLNMHILYPSYSFLSWDG